MEHRALAAHRCVALLRTQELGRIGFTQDALPSIAPVTYFVEDGAVVIRTSVRGNVLDRQVIAFSADALDLRERTGWSVVVVGKAALLSAEDADPLPAAWDEGPPEYALRIPISVVHGRVRRMAVEPCADVS